MVNAKAGAAATPHPQEARAARSHQEPRHRTNEEKSESRETGPGDTAEASYYVLFDYRNQ